MRAIATLATIGTLAVVTAFALERSPHSHTTGSSQAESTVTSSAVPLSESEPTATPTPTTIELPQGGTKIFPDYRLVGFCGQPRAKGQGPLHSNLDQVMKRLDGVIGEYVNAAEQDHERRKKHNAEVEAASASPEPTAESSESATTPAATKPKAAKKPKATKTTLPEPAVAPKTLPVVELIITTVHGKPGADGMFRSRGSDETVQRYLDLARRNKGLLLLNIQPGRADFIDEVKHLAKWLKEPDVGLALDPEWAVDAGQIPGKVFGNTSAEEINEVSKFVSDIVAEHNLPEKVIVFHQLHANIVKNQDQVKEYPGIVTIKSVDGIGSPGAKIDTYNRLVKELPDSVHTGFKLFYEEDVKTGKVLMTPKQVMALNPQPKYVMYE